MDYIEEAKNILYEHTKAYMQGCKAEYKSNYEMLDNMYDECAFILTDYMLEGKYTPMQYAAIRNELGLMIWKLFEPFIEDEDETEMQKFVNHIDACT